MKNLFVLLVLSGIVGIGIASNYDEDIHAFGSHESELKIRVDDPAISIQDSKANIIWQVRNQNVDSEIIFTQVVDGKTAITPKTILKEPRIGFTEIISQDDNIVVIHEQYTPNNKSPPSFYVLISHDDGITFSEPKLLLAGDDGIHYDINIVQMVNQKLYIFGTMWTRAENTSYAFYSFSDDFGKTFSGPAKHFNQGKVNQDISVAVSDGVIYLLFDDEKNFDEKGHLYLIKILPDGTVTEKVSTNNAETSVTGQKIAVSGDDVYVAWLDRIYEKRNQEIVERWYQSFAVSHDGGLTFEKSKHLPSDPDSIDTYGDESQAIFVTDDTLHVFWESDYWDGTKQTIKTFVGTSDNKGKDFQMEEIPASSFTSQYGRVFTIVDSDKQYYFAPGVKNYPYENSAMHFNVKDKNGNYSETVDILQGYHISPGGIIADVDDGFVHVVTDPDYNSNCILYHYSSDDGKNFNAPIDLAQLETDKECLGKMPEIEPPLKQIANGILKNNIECTTDITNRHVLMMKKSDGRPVCISHEHILPLQKRGYIDENSFTKFAIMTGEQFVQSLTQEGNSVQNLDLRYYGQRDTLPPHVGVAGTFESDKQLYPNSKESENGIYKYIIGMSVQSINTIHKAVLDNKWDLLGEKFVDLENQNIIENDPVDYPTIITIEDPINKRNLLPLAITDVDTNVHGQATWDRFSISREGDNTKGVVWDFLPKGSGGWDFVDEHGDDVWDDSVIDRDNFAVFAAGIAYLAICEDKRVDITNGISPTIPILPEVNTVYMTERNLGILPDSQGNYHVEFLSLYPTLVNLPQNATDSDIETSLCILEKPENKAEYAYFTEIGFRLSN